MMVHFSNGYTLDETTHDLMRRAFEQLVEEKESGRIGYYLLPESSMALADEVDSFTQANTLYDHVKTVVVIGIGGSSLGIKAVDSLLSHQKEGERKLLFFENSDPVEISGKLGALDKETSLFIVISKSGSTIETTSIFKTLIAHCDLELDGDDRQRVITITDEGSSLSRFADHYGLQQFNLPHNVGGRFSVLSAVGIVPLQLAGYDVRALLLGAKTMCDSFFEGKEQHLLEKAAFMASHSQTYSINVIFSYATALENLTKWYVQLWGESLGKIDKTGKSVGMTPIGLIGAVDQHSFLQLIIEGPKDKTVTFINVDDFENALSIPNVTLPFLEKTDFINNRTFNELINAQCTATKQSVAQSAVPVDSITLARVDAEHIGTMIIYYELLTSLAGAMLNVNTYDQPGVELGKTILYESFSK